MGLLLKKGGIVDFLKSKGFAEEDLKTEYESARLKGESGVVVIFKSGKVLVQGSKTKSIKSLLIENGFIEEEGFIEEKGKVIGSDEALKGDTFGGITVGGVRADTVQRKRLLELGVGDSKRISDERIRLLALKIRSEFDCYLINLFPEEYNSYRDKTKLLNDIHRQCAKYLGSGLHVIDKFPGCVVGDRIEVRAESKYLEVAAASIIARAAALEQIDELSRRAGFKLPLGSTHVKTALLRLKEKGLNPKEFVKLDFRNVKEVFGEVL